MIRMRKEGLRTRRTEPRHATSGDGEAGSKRLRAHGRSTQGSGCGRLKREPRSAPEGRKIRPQMADGPRRVEGKEKTEMNEVTGSD